MCIFVKYFSYLQQVLICRLGKTCHSHGVAIKFLNNPSREVLDTLSIRVDSPSIPHTLMRLHPMLTCPYSDFYFILPKKFINTTTSIDEPVEIIISMIANPDEELVFHCEGGAKVYAQKSMVLGKNKTIDVIRKYDGPEKDHFQFRDQPGHAVELWVQHLYYGDVSHNLTMDNAVDVCLVAHIFNSPELLADATRFIGYNMSAENIPDLLKLAFHYHLVPLVEEVAAFMIDSLEVQTLEIFEWVRLLEDRDTTFLCLVFTALHNLFVRYLKGAYIPTGLAQKQKDILKKSIHILNQISHFKDMEVIFSYFEKRLPEAGDENNNNNNQS